MYRMCCGCRVTVWFRSRGDGKSGFSVVRVVVRVVGVPAEKGKWGVRSGAGRRRVASWEARSGGQAGGTMWVRGAERGPPLTKAE